MDAASEETRQLTQTRMHCLILEADRDAEALRAEKYRKILESLAGEDGPTQPHVPRRALDVPQPTSNPTEGQVGSTTARCPSVHPPVIGSSRQASDRTAATVLQAHSDLDEDVIVLDEEPHTGGSASTSASQHGRKKRTSPSHINPAQITSTKRRRSLDIPPQSSRISRSGPRNSGVGDSPVMALDVARIMRRAGLMPLEPTRAEATRIEETPGIGWSTFTKLFGGNLRSEWPQCSNVWGYSDFLCADIIAQPFVPHAAGKPGLLFRLPTVIEAPRTEKRSIYVLSNMLQKPALCYRGNYTTVPLPEVEIDWTDLPHSFKDRWSKRVSTLRASTTTRALCARIQLRNKRNREPSVKEVLAHLERFKDDVTYKEVSAAFRSGEEKMVIEGLRCTGYDSNLATVIQTTVQVTDD